MHRALQRCQTLWSSCPSDPAHTKTGPLVGGSAVFVSVGVTPNTKLILRKSLSLSGTVK